MTLETPLFPASLLPPHATSSLPSTFTLRPLQRSDYARGFLDCLKDLTWVPDTTEADFNERYDEMDNTSGKGPYFYLVIEHQGRIVGTGAVIVEKKFIHNRTKVGHIEEICIAKPHQSKGLGLIMMNALNALAENVGCSKTILNCGPKNEPFYKKCGYENSGYEMTRHLGQKGSS